ncbi:holo-ACP synthase, partial [Streptomyces bacillaris]
MIIGVGIDVAEIERFGAALERTPQLADRLFVESELTLPRGGRGRGTPRAAPAAPPRGPPPRRARPRGGGARE